MPLDREDAAQSSNERLTTACGRLRGPLPVARESHPPVASRRVVVRDRTWDAASTRRLVRGHVDRQRESGEVVQRLVDPDQGPEPGMAGLQRHTEMRGADALAAIDD